MEDNMSNSLAEKIHLHDLTLGISHVAACGTDSSSDNILLHDAFEATSSELRCKLCEDELEKAKVFARTCRVCGATHDTPLACVEHEGQVHALRPVFFRGQLPCFSVDHFGHYDDLSRVARRLTSARLELKEFFALYSFDFLPGGLVLQQNSFGRIQVTQHLVIPR